MRANDRRSLWVALLWVALLFVAPALVACGGRLPARATPSLTPELPVDGTLSPSETSAPIEQSFVGALPQSTEFAGARFTVTGARITNTHPYTMFGEPKPGNTLFGLLTVEAENATDAPTDYGFDDDAFTLQTWGGAELPIVPAPGIRPFSRLEPGQRAEDVVVFGLPAPEALDDAALLIGRAPDARAIVRLSSDTTEPGFPASVAPMGTSTVHSGSLDWTILDGRASLDAPSGVCCPDTGLRADDGELFVSLTVRATVSGSQYGQATVSTDEVRLVVDGTEFEPLDFDGQANVPEGQSFEFESHWLVSAEPKEFGLRVGVGGSETVEIPLEVTGEAS
jgi:hypothetical protein